MKTSIPLSPWKRHVAKWQHCTSCTLCETRSKVVLARGDLPCEVLFVGEAPGKSEDILGSPFIGPAGQLFDKLIARAESDYGKTKRKAFTNLVACVPLGERVKVNMPEASEIRACRNRLIEFVNIAQPRLIVHVGKLANQYAIRGSEVNWQSWPSWKNYTGTKRLFFADIIHPSAILQANAVSQETEGRRTISKLIDAYSILDEKEIDVDRHIAAGVFSDEDIPY